MEMFYICINKVAMSHMQLLSTWNVVRINEKLNFIFYLILVI